MYGILEHTDRYEYDYQVTNYFAPSRFNVTCDDFKYLTDHLHQNGICVILDWIPTHFKHYHFLHQCSMSLHEYDGTNLYASIASRWETIYCDFDKEETHRILFASALYYFDRFHFDRIRFDADDTNDGSFSSKNILLNYVSHAQNDMDKFADLRNSFAWQICMPSRGHMIHMGDEVVQPVSWFQQCFRGKISMDGSLSNSTSLHGKIQEWIRDLNRLYIHYPQFWE
ncbi:unnamed protein product [Rotaria sp. Silwood2]|nr:unnamed protein product [Rotaria sp. Silwood2]